MSSYYILVGTCKVILKGFMHYNGTAVKVGYVARRSNRPVICPVRPGNCPGARRAWRGICPSERRQPGGQSRVRLFVRSRYDDESY